MTSTAKRDAKIIALVEERAASKSQSRRNSLTRQIERLAQRGVAVPAAKPAPVAAPKPAAKRDWKSAPASGPQIARINRAERKLGYRVSPASVLGTGQDARNIWRGLVADANKAGIRLNRA